MNGGDQMWVTVIARNYLSYARVLADSLARVEGQRLHVVITDVDQHVEGEPFEVWTSADVGMPRHWAFQFGRKELAAALKPLALGHALDAGASSAIFIDPDMIVARPLDSLRSAARTSEILLSPHLVRPVPGDRGRKVEREILRAGVFNGGLVAVSEGPEARRFLRWWQARIDVSCIYDVDNGIHFDQRWLDLVPSLFPTWSCMRDEGVNVGWWRLVGRSVRASPDGVFLEGSPCSLLHMSGFRPTRPSVPCLYYPELLTFDEFGPDVREVFESYARACGDAGFIDTQSLDGCWSTFDDGSTIPDAARMLFLELGDRRWQFGDPFASSGPDSFQRWLDEPIDAGLPEVTRLWFGVHALRADLREAFPDPLGCDRQSFIDWSRKWGEQELVRPYPLDEISDEVPK